MIDSTEDAKVELLIDGTWVDVTADATGDLIEITRARPNEATRVDPGSCRLSLADDDGRYSNRNPNSPFFGLLGRNTPIRVTAAGVGDRYTALSPYFLANILSADNAQVDITGDIDIRIDLAADDWRQIGLAQKYTTAGNNRSWFVYMVGTQPTLRWSSDGTFGTVVDRTATEHAPVVPGHRLALRVTLDVDNGAGGHTVTFYTAPTIAGPWTQLGDPVVTAGTTSIHSGSAELRLADNHLLAVTKPSGRLYGFELYDGINGTLACKFDPADGQPGPEAFWIDTTGRGWSVYDTWVADPNIRFSGEVASWPPRSDPTGTVVRVPVEASGILRRLARSRTVLESAFRRQALDPLNLQYTVGYWPLEDGPDAAQAASGLPGGPPMTVLGEPNFGSDSTSFPGSAPLPNMGESTSFYASIPPHEGTGTIAFRGLFTFPDLGLVDGTHLVHLWQSTTQILRWQLTYTSGGGLRLAAIAPGGGTLDSAGVAMDVDGKAMMIGFTVIQEGDDAHWHIFGRYVSGGQVIQAGLDGVFDDLTVDTSKRLYVYGATGMTLGHILVGTDVYLAQNIDEGMTGYTGETAAHRIRRVCAEANIPVGILGDPDDSEPCGPQQIASPLDIIQEAAAADGGILYEPRDWLGLVYRTRAHMYNQVPRATFSVTGEELTPPLEPVDDDQLIRNDVTATRLRGSSVRAALESGPLSILDPPDGVGVYRYETTVNVAADTQLADVANWELRLGTWDDARYPTVRLDPVALANQGKVELARAAAGLDVGDRFRLTDLPPWLSTNDVDLLVQGVEERIDGYEWQMSYNASPGGPWAVAEVWDEDAAHGLDPRVAGGDDMVLAAGVDETDTQLLVVSLSGRQRWVTVDDDLQAPSDFPHDAVVGGERVTVTGTGAAFVDRFTRTVSNGLGTPDSSVPGTPYTVSGSASAYSVVGGTTGRIATGSVNTLYLAHADMGASDGEIRVRTTVPVLPTGAAITVRVNGRVTDASNYYEAQLTIATSGAVSVAMFKRVGGSGSVLASGGGSVTLRSTHSAGNSWWIALRYIGSSLAAKGWKDGEAEPAGWLTTGTDTSLTSGTRIGVSCRRETGNTDGSQDIDFDDLIATAPQVLTVARSVNGVAKAHAAGEVVEVAEPAYVGR